MPPDKIYYYDAQVDANVYFDSGKVQEGLQSLYDHLDHGYRPIDVHMHILFFVSLRKRLLVRGKSVINERQAALANKTLLALSKLINNPTSLVASCIPTCERGSAARCADYTVREYPLYRVANKMVRDATGGVWDLVLESKEGATRGSVERRRCGIEAGFSDEEDEEVDEEEANILAVASRGANDRSTGCGRGPPGIKVKTEKMGRQKRDSDTERANPCSTTGRLPSSSPLTEEEEDEDEEVVNRNGWFLLDWTLDLWMRSRTDSKDPYNDHFLRQLPSQGGSGARWSIARPISVIRSAIKSATIRDVYADPLQVGIKMMSLLYTYSKLHPPAIDPEALFTALVRELTDIDNSDGLSRLERYYEMLQAATDPEYVNRVLAHALACAMTSSSFNSQSFDYHHPSPTLSDILEWLPTTRLSEKRTRGMPLSAHEEKYTCIKAYLLVNLLTTATEFELREWPRDRRRDVIDKVFAESDDDEAARNRSSRILLPQECTLDEYKALVVLVHENLQRSSIHDM